MYLSVARVFLMSLLGIGLFMPIGCVSSKKSNGNFPMQADFPDYDLINAIETSSVSLTVKKNQKIAVVVKDLSVTAYSNLEQPRYNKSYVFFEGEERCCAPKEPLMGASGLRVYKFQVLNNSGKTTIDLIARHKGLSTTKSHYDSDIVTKINLKIK